MEIFSIIAFLILFVYIFGYHFRYSYGTKEILNTNDGYKIVSYWGIKKIERGDIIKEERGNFWDLCGGLGYNPFRSRCYAYLPSSNNIVVTLKTGFIRHHILPVYKIHQG